MVTTRVFATDAAPIRVKSPKSAPLSAEDKKARTAFVEKEMATDKIAQLRAEQARLRDEMKALRESAKANRLDAVKASQREHPNKALVYTLAAALRARLSAGQERETATEEILAQVRELLDAADVAKRERKAKAESDEQ